MTKTMAEVLAGHYLIDHDSCSCSCDEMFYDTRRTVQQIKVEHSLHVEERLDNAGFGLVADAKGEALEEAADAAEGMHDPAAPDCKEWADWLRARATELRTP